MESRGETCSFLRPPGEAAVDRFRLQRGRGGNQSVRTCTDVAGTFATSARFNLINMTTRADRVHAKPGLP